MKCAIVSGASRGIGAEIAQKFARAGYFTVVNYFRSTEEAQALCRRLNAEGGMTLPVRADISRPEQAEALVAEACAAAGGVDVLVNNAGVAKSGMLTELSDDDIRTLLDTDLGGTIFLCRAAAKRMLPRHNGTIVNIASMWGEVGGSCESVYSAAKGGVIALTKALAKELGCNGITVNAVAPGLIDTRMNAGFSAEELAAVVADTPCGRIGTPADVAECVFWLTQPAASFVNGQIIGVNGGLVV